MSIFQSFDSVQFSGDIGGKATNLARLHALQIPVPNWAVFTSKSLSGRSLTEDENITFSEKELSELSVPFGADFKEKTYAVRSSASDEDGGEFSFAGLFETRLHVPFSALESSISEIWKSGKSERVKAYREKNNLSEDSEVNVIVQEMIEPEVSGVAFGMNPINGDRSVSVISAVYGLGEGLVSGELDADIFRIKEGKIEEELADKTHAFRRGENGHGISKIEVDIQLQKAPSLNAETIQKIAIVLKKLEAELGFPQDIEFAVKNGELFLLQTRPVTTHQGEYILWDNSNIIESYPGITTPLTFTFINKMYEAVYRQFSGILGVKENEIESHSEVFKNTLGLVRGRVYYNLLSWYKMLAMVPGYSINAEFMEKMMGVQERFELKEDYQMSKRLAWTRIIGMVFRMIKMQRNLPAERDKFLAHLEKVMSTYGAIDFQAHSPEEIVTHYRAFETTLLLEWKAPLINDFLAMIWFGMLEKQAVKNFPNNQNIHNDLLCGSQDIISVEPIRKSLHISKLVSEDAAAKKLFLENTPQDIWEVLKEGNFDSIHAAVLDYLETFGERCVGELKLETVSYTQKPSLFIKVIKSYVSQGVVLRVVHSSVEDELRANAESLVNNHFKGKIIKKWWFNLVTKNARDAVSNRENLRYERTRGFGMVRRMFSALGDKWFELGKLENPRDVFYLELAEILESEKTGFKAEWTPLIKERKAEFENFATQRIPQERFFTYGQNFTDEYIYSDEKLEKAENDLSGIGCCPGLVTAKVRVVTDPNEIDSLDNDILVTSSTDPGWVTLFPTCAGIIVERGSLLSHSAIVSREMGIPCIVSVKGLLRTLKTGDEITMDGSTGVIKMLKNG